MVAVQDEVGGSGWWFMYVMTQIQLAWLESRSQRLKISDDTSYEWTNILC